jgi:hypothetical protein
MDKSYVLIAGSGITSRANVEALIEDYFYAKGKDSYLVLAFDKTLSQGQLFAAQYAKDKGKDIILFCREGSNVGSVPTASVSFSKSPITDAIDLANTVMLLWDETEQSCMIAAEYCDSIGKTAYNLCEGLTIIKQPAPTDEVVVVPVEPEKEHTFSPKLQVPVYPDQSLTEAQKAEIAKLVMAAVESAVHNALKKA